MDRDKKWASNKKDQLLVENFKKFMEEGGFSSELINETEDGEFFDGVNPPNWGVNSPAADRSALKEVFEKIDKDLREISYNLGQLDRIISSTPADTEKKKAPMEVILKEILDKMSLFFSDFEESRLKFLHYKNHGLEEKQAKRLSDFYNVGVDIKNGLQKMTTGAVDPAELAMVQADQKAFLGTARAKINLFLQKHLKGRIESL